MPDLPLVGGHAPGTSSKVESETCINLFIENSPAGPYLRNRYGLERRDRHGATPGAPSDPNQDIDNLTVAAGTCTVDHATIRYGYDIGDTVDITLAADADFNDTWTITDTATDGLSFEFELSENGVSPTTESTTAAVVQLTGGLYNKEIRLMQRYTSTNFGVPILYAVIGNRVYAETPSTGWGFTENTLAADRFISTKGPVAGAQMGEAGFGNDQVILCDGVAANHQGYTSLTLTYTSSAWSSSALSILSNTATFMDGYIIRDDKSNKGRFYYSGLYDSSEENAFAFATAEGSWDNLSAVLADRRQLWLFGEFTTEIWYNTGDQNNPFQRFQGGFIQLGITAPMTAKRFDNSVVWLSQDRRGLLTVVRAGDDFQPIMISTPQINKLLSDRREYVGNAFAMVVRIEGHEFYILTLPSAMGETLAIPTDGPTPPTPITLIYDSNSKAWFSWQSADAIVDENGRWSPTCSISMFDSSDRVYVAGRSYGNNILIGGRDSSGEYYLLSPEVYVDEHVDGNQPIACERTLAPVQGPDFDRVNAGPIELVTDSDATETISVTLSYAKDGKTFGSALTRSVTATSSRLLWKNVGRARRWIFKVAQSTTATLPVRWLRLISKRLGE